MLGADGDGVDNNVRTDTLCGGVMGAGDGERGTEARLGEFLVFLLETSTSFRVTRKLEYLIRPGISATQLV